MEKHKAARGERLAAPSLLFSTPNFYPLCFLAPLAPGLSCFPLRQRRINREVPVVVKESKKQAGWGKKKAKMERIVFLNLDLSLFFKKKKKKNSTAAP